ncbi:ABC transporter ATP-binding protein [Oricola sp.]|uniref:ABC transporter ATP-binding protein n=1 Tax=Oricola sp. TaxID=1979950 RepID=UPI0035142ED2
MLEVRNLSVSYGAHRALENVSVNVAAGEICVILGANGAGKSSLLKAIGGMVRSAPGAQILINGQDITQTKPHKVVEAGLALVPEGRGIFGDLTVSENLQLGAYGPQARDSEAMRREEVLRLFPRLAERRNQIARTMSGGEQQMVAIGRALMSNPVILMLDEPSLGLSPLLTKDLFKSLKAVRETGVGILLVEQNAKQSLAIADRGYLIENGHITGEGTGAELAQDPAVQAAYLGGAAAKSTQSEAIMRDEHRRFYVPAGAAGGAGNGAAAETVAPLRVAANDASAARADHGQNYVPAGAAGNGAHAPRAVASSSGGAVARAEHRQFYVPAAATGGSRTVPAANGGAITGGSNPPAASGGGSEHRQFYVPSGATGTGNGTAHALAQTPANKGDAIVMSNQAHELSLQAAEMAARATRIQRQHVEALRVDSHLSAASKLIAHVQETSGAEAKTSEDSSKKMLKKAEKLARKAEKLARKAAAMQAAD